MTLKSLALSVAFHAVYFAALAFLAFLAQTIF